MVSNIQRKNRNSVESVYSTTSNAKGIKLKMQEWAPKLINSMWDHATRLWHYRDDAVHIRDTKQVAQFKIDALEREKE
jgi:hypothetical protein